MPWTDSGALRRAAIVASALALGCKPEPAGSAPVYPIEGHALAPSSVPGPSASPEPSATAAAPAAPRAAPPPEALALSRFYGALWALAGGTRTRHVRVLWLGDSHTAADYLTGVVRRRLEERFGAGGPGFVRLGTNPYRHDGVRVERLGRWKTEPTPASRKSRPGDPPLGLGGIRAIPLNHEAWARARVSADRARGRLRASLSYQLAARSSLLLVFGAAQETLRGDGAERGGISRFDVEFERGGRFSVGGAKGEAAVLGVVIEGTEPGVVLDTVGIDGARLATALSWDDESFTRAIAERSPELAVVAYGTNEAFDTRAVEVIEEELVELGARLRRAAPEADCLVLGPPDAADSERGSLPRIAEIEAAERRAALRAGCGFFSLRAAMGGEGSFVRWASEVPPLARGDRVHLTVRGYERLGNVLADALLAAFAREAAVREQNPP